MGAPLNDGAELEALWIEHAREVEEVLGRALQAGSEPRRRALEALDGTGREVGIGLGPLTVGVSSAAATEMLGTIGDRLRDRVAALLDDPDPQIRRLAVRVASKLRDGRVGVSHLHALVAGPAPDSETEAAALLAARALLDSGRVSGTTVIDSLRELLADASWERRLTVVRVMRLVGPPARRQLEGALRDSSPFVRAEAFEALR